ncbi:ATP-binding mismatch repair protein [Neurospora sp. IMI 360204]|nr:ATP-binding mismatch repair protein [Neurospora sp. IMI 360204]
MASDGAIKAIDPSTIHQIQSGQVIVDLCSVAKELVENALDAGATTIDVRFKNQGLDSIEVQDNGSGISSSNYESIALKHYTSKLSTYDDLSTLQTFGFRGEALSSLCALSHFTIVTCTQKEAPKATKLEFETSGKLKSTSVVSGQRGTTVSVENLFKSLPVRRRELERNIKREWGKVVNLLNQYACIQTGVKFTVSQQPTKGKRMVLFSTKGNPTTRENIINVFGVKTMTALIAMDLRLQLKPSNTGLLSKAPATDQDTTTEVRICGHISRPAHGKGRQTPDRQMFYVNGRPCGLPQFAKVFNEVYRSYNSTQSPFIFADIQLDTHLYDVNVSPDKRTILLHDQGQLLDNLRESLIELFELQDVTIPVSHTLPLKSSTFRGPSTVPSGSVAQARGRDNRDASEEPDSSLPSDKPENVPGGNRTARSAINEDSDEAVSDDDAKSTRSTGSQTKAVPSRSTPANTQASNLLSRWLERKSEVRKQSISAAPITKDSNRERSLAEKGPASPDRASGDDAESDAEQDIAEDNEEVEDDSRTRELFAASAAASQGASKGLEMTTEDVEMVDEEEGEEENEEGNETEKEEDSDEEALFVSQTKDVPAVEVNGDDEDAQSECCHHDDDDEEYIDEDEKKAREEKKVQEMIKAAETKANEPTEEGAKRSQSFVKGRLKRKDLTFNLAHRVKTNEENIRSRMEAWAQYLPSAGKAGSSPQESSNGEQATTGLDAADAEEKLSLKISKSDFAKMKIVGQFNLGFIIAVREASTSSSSSSEPSSSTKEDDELFIIDQHASDEKYNFERLQSTTTVQSQRLVQPKPLTLTAVEEEIILEHLPILSQNGFSVHVDTSGSSPLYYGDTETVQSEKNVCHESVQEQYHDWTGVVKGADGEGG